MRCVKAIVLSALLAVAACRKTADVNIGGMLSGVEARDSVFVTLSRDWDRGVTPPVSFDIDSEGKYALRLTIGSPPPPITFVKNDTLLARLEFKNTWGYAPILVDRVSGREYRVTVASESLLNVRQVNLP